MSKVKTFPDLVKLSRAAAEFFVTVAKDAIEDRERFTTALSGGSTPESLYALLGSDAYAARLDWSKVHIFWGDERCVPPDHLDSNYRMARQALLDNVPIPPSNVYRIRGELKPDEAAADYESQLRSFFGGEPRFDLVLLGMGADGHTASLFPRSTALEAGEALVVATYVDELRVWRVTLTANAINSAANVVFLVAGKSKAERVKQAIEGDANPRDLPARLIAPKNGKLIWLIDEEAASLLDKD